MLLIVASLAAYLRVLDVLGFLLATVPLMLVLLRGHRSGALADGAADRRLSHARRLVGAETLALIQLPAGIFATSRLDRPWTSSPASRQGFAVALQPINLLYCFIGVFIGTLVGVLPGIGPVSAMSLLLPVTFAGTPEAGIIMLAGIYYGSMYGGSTTSILVNIPGEAASVVTCLDGHQMAQAGPRRAGARHRGDRLVHRRHARDRRR